jgi:hypothetical protein
MTGSTPSDLTPSCCGGLLLSPIQRRPSEEGKNYPLQLLKCTLLQPREVRSPRRPEEYGFEETESHRGKKFNSGGSDPL